MRLGVDARVIVRRHDKVVYRDGNRLVKVFSADKPSADVFNEALNTSRVAPCGIPLSDCLEVSQMEGGEYDGCWALANRYIEGRSLRELLLEDPDGVDRHVERFVEGQLRMHGHRVPTLVRQKDKLIRMVSATRGVLDATMRYELHIRIDGMRTEDAVCHGDYVPSNVIVGEDGELYLCDWAHATAGLPEVDVAATYLKLSMRYPDFGRRFLELYCDRASLPRQIVEHWLPVVAAAELSRGHEADRDYLLGWVDLH